MRLSLFFLLAVAYLTYIPVTIAGTVETPHFVGSLSISPILDKGSDGALWVLNDDFGFFDGSALWLAKKADKTDGASIPSFLWVLLGHPFNTKYIQAAVIHDRYCQIGHRKRSWQDTHRMFYAALIAADNTGHITAKAMFYAVYLFGPRWELVTVKSCGIDDKCIDVQRGTAFQPSWGTDNEVRRAYEEILSELQSGDISLAVLESRATQARSIAQERADAEARAKAIAEAASIPAQKINEILTPEDIEKMRHIYVAPAK